jgi:hypothetical protein
VRDFRKSATIAVFNNFFDVAAIASQVSANWRMGLPHTFENSGNSVALATLRVALPHNFQRFYNLAVRLRMRYRVVPYCLALFPRRSI